MSTLSDIIDAAADEVLPQNLSVNDRAMEIVDTIQADLPRAISNHLRSQLEIYYVEGTGENRLDNSLLLLEREFDPDDLSAPPETFNDNIDIIEGQYLAYAAPYSTYPGGSNDGLIAGIDFRDTITIRRGQFPNNIIIRGRWPYPPDVSGYVAAYCFVSYGNYHTGVPDVPVVSQQVGNLTAFQHPYDWTLTGDANYVTVLNEFFLTYTEGDGNDIAAEIGLVLHASDEGGAFFDAAVEVGTFTDSVDRLWRVKHLGPNPYNKPFIIFLPYDGVDVHTGVADHKAMLEYLVGLGLVEPSWWINGVALGVEIHGGVSEWFNGAFSVTFTGEGAEIPPPDQIEFNGTFDKPDGWDELWFGGKGIFAGELSFQGSPQFAGTQHDFDAEVDKSYRITITVNAVTEGGVAVGLVEDEDYDNMALGTTRTAPGTYEQTLYAGQPYNTIFVSARLSGDNSFKVGSISFVEVPNNRLVNGDFETILGAGWEGFYFDGKWTEDGRVFFDSTGDWGPVVPYSGIHQPQTFVPGKYYQVTILDLVRTAGAVRATFGGGTQRDGPEWATSGNPVARLLANTGNNHFYIMPAGDGFEGDFEEVILNGPYDTDIVDGD